MAALGELRAASLTHEKTAAVLRFGRRLEGYAIAVRR